jgi:hypothetical protein
LRDRPNPIGLRQTYPAREKENSSTMRREVFYTKYGIRSFRGGSDKASRHDPDIPLLYFSHCSLPLKKSRRGGAAQYGDYGDTRRNCSLDKTIKVYFISPAAPENMFVIFP